jgi:hypothetical protein
VSRSYSAPEGGAGGWPAAAASRRPAAFLVDQHRRIRLAADNSEFSNEVRYLIWRLDIAFEQDEAPWAFPRMNSRSVALVQSDTPVMMRGCS